MQRKNCGFSKMPTNGRYAIMVIYMNTWAVPVFFAAAACAGSMSDFEIIRNEQQALLQQQQRKIVETANCSSYRRWRVTN